MPILSCLLLFAIATTTAKPMTVENLRCEYQTDPLGIDVGKPRLSWWLKASERGAAQTAYQILVASSPDLLKKNKGDLWDTGQLKKSESIQVTYNGESIKPNQTVYWKVRVWDEKGTAGAWSKPASWTRGIGWKWKGEWIRRHERYYFAPVDPYDDDPAQMFRKEFAVDKPVAKATLYMAGLGYFEPRLNGSKVGDHQLDPGWTDFSQRVSYSAFDVTKQLKPGANVVGAILGNGFYNPLPLKMWGHLNLREHLPIGSPRMIAQLEIQYADGTKTMVKTDPTWKIGDGPILRNSVYLGEVVDARREVKGWDTASFDAANWEPATHVEDTFKPILSAQQTPPIRITKTLKPVRITEPRPGVYIVDFGQNFAGVTRMFVKGASGTKVRLRSGELLYEDGTLNGMTSVTGQIKGGGKDYVYPGKGEPKTAFQIDEYICKGEGREVFQPRFTFHGFRYVEVTGYPGKPTLADFEGLRMNSDVEKVGSFECSNPMFNQIQTMVEWTLLSNLFSVQSDCPHREKFGYGGDQVATSEMAMYTFDMARFYANTVDLLAESQRLNGGFTETAPYVGIADEGLGGQSGPVEWGSAYLRLGKDLEDYYGNQRLGESDQAGQKWLYMLVNSSVSGILVNGISDHESIAPKPQALTGTAFLNANLIWADFWINGNGYPPPDKNAKVIRYSVDQFIRKFLDQATGKYDIGTQACQAIPLALGFVPDDMKAKVLDVLIKDIEAHDGHLTTGIFGTKYLFQALSENGRDDIAYRIANQRTFPGWGHMIEKGATTLWEHWEFSDNTFSHNHPMFGSISEWFYKSLLGIRSDAPGFKKIVIKPSVVGDLTWAKGHHDCPYGRIESSWKREGNKLTLDVTIPPNTTAIIVVPSGDATPDSQSHVKQLNKTSNRTVFEVLSGSYRFTGKV